MEGRLEEARHRLSHFVVLNPQHAEAHNNLGLVLQRLGCLDEAIAAFQRAILIRPNYLLALSNLGAALAATDRVDQALESYRAALNVDPLDLVTLNNLGAALQTLGRHLEASEHLQLAVSLAPDFTDARVNLGEALRDCGRRTEALDHFLAASALRPSDAEIQLKLATLFYDLGLNQDAIRHFRRSQALRPTSAAASTGLGRALQELGEIEGARLAFRQAIDCEPQIFSNYLSLAHITRFDRNDPYLTRMLNANTETLLPGERINAHFALGKALSDIGRHEEGFQHLLLGNAARHQTIEYNEIRVLCRLQKIKDSITAGYLERWPPLMTPQGPTPIFIVGMPRSGSTLVEQIFAGHPLVQCAGETDALRDTFVEHAEDGGWRYPDQSFIPSLEQGSSIAARYLHRLLKAMPSKKKETAAITNKMPNNYRNIMVILKLFPNAKVIYTFRSPVDTCLSCFSINFASQRFTFDLGELGRYYRAYSILMQHWRSILPTGSILDVRYEALVQNFAQNARAIVEFSGLPWDDACLDFHKAERAVRTASLEQVRRPIYHSSIRRWRPSPDVLRPLIEGLGWSEAQTLSHTNRA